MSDTQDDLELVDEILTRAADEMGDITEPVMALYYQQHPDAKESFEQHGAGNREQLEGMMVGNALYCLMYCLRSPEEIRILLRDSVPHHDETLKVPPVWYLDLVDVTAELIEGTIPEGNEAEARVWAQVRQSMKALFEECAPG